MQRTPFCNYGKSYVKEVISIIELCQPQKNRQIQLLKFCLLNGSTLFKSFSLFMCPDEWSNYWTGPRESAEYLNAVIFKAKSTQEILSASEKGDFLQNPVNLSMLFRPTTLLNALRQATARKMSKALDELRLVSSWDNRPQAGAVLSMQVKGIQLQGALFDGLLRETSSSSPPTTVAPPLALSWMPLDSSPASSSDSVLVPLYSDSDRQSLIAPVTMPCRNPDQWNIAAVALFLK
ncbi:hypothetical protein WR25_18204 [Diploscapter pachys]|uniref:Dynein heavy chain C-terminal domain-containing protein n=1 Tax=Diploscapter pachys TaxID=2018661 RepID=A0A2A2L5W3_9BILA|nr:hypothetical protein WR25_18204 [Diploscapter pachys]